MNKRLKYFRAEPCIYLALMASVLITIYQFFGSIVQFHAQGEKISSYLQNKNRMGSVSVALTNSAENISASPEGSSHSCTNSPAAQSGKASS